MNHLLHRYLQLPISRKAFISACILHGTFFLGLIVSFIVPSFFKEPKPEMHVFTLVSGGSNGQVSNNQEISKGFEVGMQASGPQVQTKHLESTKSTQAPAVAPKSPTASKTNIPKTPVSSAQVPTSTQLAPKKSVKTLPTTDKTVSTSNIPTKSISFEAYQKQYGAKQVIKSASKGSPAINVSDTPTINGKIFAENLKNAVNTGGIGIGTGTGIGDGTASGHSIGPVSFHNWAKSQWEIVWGEPKNFIVGTFAEVMFNFDSRGCITNFKIVRSSKDVLFNKRIEDHISMFNERIQALNRINKGPQAVPSTQTYMFSIKNNV